MFSFSRSSSIFRLGEKNPPRNCHFAGVAGVFLQKSIQSQNVRRASYSNAMYCEIELPSRVRGKKAAPPFSRERDLAIQFRNTWRYYSLLFERSGTGWISGGTRRPLQQNGNF